MFAYWSVARAIGCVACRHSLSLRGSKRVNAALPRVTAAGGRSAYTFRIVLLALAAGIVGVLHKHVCLSRL